MNAAPTIATLHAAYRKGETTPRALVARLRASQPPDDPAWIHRCDDAFIEAQLDRLEARAEAAEGPDRLPLYGVPFAVKDNIDVAGLPTTAACPAFAYTAARSATVVERLLEAGAILLGKTNLDQFATGLVGTRSPYGEVPNPFDADYVSGGSSSGSASVVARGLAAFSLGTDTAGSGRIPAGFCNLVGLKPTPGLVSNAGVVPACRSLDCVSVFALTAADAARVLAVLEGTEGEPVFQRSAPRAPYLPELPRLGVPVTREWHGNDAYAACFDAALHEAERLGATLVPVDFEPLFAIARLLYDGPWVAERYAATEALIENDPDAMDPVVRQVIGRAGEFDAVAAFRALYRLRELRLQADALWQQVDALMVPTAPTHPTRAAVAAEPVLRNSVLGRYTNFVNLLGQAAIALPAGFTPAGMPFGVTFIAPGGSDAALAHWGARWQAALGLPLGRRLGAADADVLALQLAPTAEEELEICVVGAHLRGMPLHGQLTERHCRFLGEARTAPRYRLYALAGTVPPKPGLARVGDAGSGDGGDPDGSAGRSGPGAAVSGAQAGAAIEVERYAMPMAQLGSFLALIPSPLGLGTVELDDGRQVKGFICEPWGLEGALDITHHGGWRGYIASRSTQ